MSRHVDRDRALWAAECVQEIYNKQATWASDYRSDVRGLPAMIQSCGLAQTLAFYRAKAKGNNQDRYGTVARHLCKPLVEQKLTVDEQEALKQILALDTSNYRRATLEVQAFLLWLKRFAEAQLPEK